MQRAEIDAAREGIVRFARLLVRSLFIERDDRVVSRIEFLDPRQMQLEYSRALTLRDVSSSLNCVAVRYSESLAGIPIVPCS
jgi:hypothetical protein